MSDETMAWHMDVTSPKGETRTMTVMDGPFMAMLGDKDSYRESLIATGWRCGEWRAAFGDRPDITDVVRAKLEDS